MTCASCVGHVTKAIASTGATDVNVNLALNRATASVPDGVTTDQLIVAIERAGYSASPHSQSGLDTRQGSRANSHVMSATGHDHSDNDVTSAQRKREVVLSAVAGLPVVILAMTGNTSRWSLIVQLVLSLFVVMWCGRSLFKSALNAARHRTSTMDTLVCLGVGAAMITSIGQMPTLLAQDHQSNTMDMSSLSGNHVYFEAAVVVVTFVLLGRLIEARLRAQTGSSLRALYLLKVREATVVVDGVESSVATDQVAIDDVVVVRPGAQVPIDGDVIEGSSTLDLSHVSGESSPVTVAVGDAVISGAVNGNGVLQIRVTALDADSTITRIVALVESAQNSKPRMQRIVDRVANVFVPIVLALAAFTFAGWALAGDASRGLDAALTVLVIACPCALGLATPTALLAGTGVAAQHGILIRDADVLEQSLRIDTAVFDKTGTLTTASAGVIDADLDNETLALAAAVERTSDHPIAGAITAYAKLRGVAIYQATNAQALPGHGVSAIVNGHTVIVGKPSDAASPHDVEVTIDGVSSGTLNIGESLSQSAHGAIAAIRKLDIEPVICSGDSVRRVDAIANSLGVERRAGAATPADKIALIRQLQSQHRSVLMAGDGLNDAAALAAADLSIAMGSGTDVARESSDIVLLRDDLSAIANAIVIARATHRTIRINLFWASIYNLAALPIAMTGRLSPMIASGAMAASSVLVVGNSARLRYTKLRPGPMSPSAASRAI